VFASPAETRAEGGEAEHAASSACSFFLLRTAAGVAGPSLSETGVQRRPAGARLVIVVVRHMRLFLLRRCGSVDYRNVSASQSMVLCHIEAVSSIW
jgi:hypothetical protein